jgi:hypothetical protein
MKHLQHVIVNNSYQLDSIPGEIADLKYLENLMIMTSQIQSLPLELEKLEKLGV